MYPAPIRGRTTALVRSDTSCIATTCSETNDQPNDKVYIIFCLIEVKKIYMRN